MKYINDFYNRLRSSKFIEDSFWSLIGNVIAKGLALFAGILIARWLGKDVYGEYGIVKTIIMSVSVFSTFGLGFTATKFIASSKNENTSLVRYISNYVIKVTVIFSSFIAFLIFVFSEEIAVNMLYASHLSYALKVVAIIIIFNAVNTTQIGIISGLGEFKLLAKLNAIIGIITFFITIVLAYLYNFDGALYALLLTTILNCFANNVFIKKKIDILGNNNVSIVTNTIRKEILNLSVPVALQESLYSVTSWLSSFLIIKYAGYGELGLYSAALQWNAIILFIPGIMRNVILSHLSTSSNNIERHHRVLKMTLMINAASTLVPAFLIGLFSTAIGTFYGKSFNGISSLIFLGVLITFFTSLSNVYAQAFMSLKKNWLMFSLRFLRDFSALIIFIILFKYFKYQGARAMILSSIFTSFIFLLFISLIYSKIKNKMTNYN